MASIQQHSAATDLDIGQEFDALGRAPELRRHDTPGKLVGCQHPAIHYVIHV
jgi:hypothetical protein